MPASSSKAIRTGLGPPIAPTYIEASAADRQFLLAPGAVLAVVEPELATPDDGEWILGGEVENRRDAGDLLIDLPLQGSLVGTEHALDHPSGIGVLVVDPGLQPAAVSGGE